MTDTTRDLPPFVEHVLSVAPKPVGENAMRLIGPGFTVDFGWLAWTWSVGGCSDTFDKTGIQTTKSYPQAVKPAVEGRGETGADDKVPTLRVEGTKSNERVRPEMVGTDLALDGRAPACPALDDEVDLTSRLVAPIEQGGGCGLGAEEIQD